MNLKLKVSSRFNQFLNPQFQECRSTAITQQSKHTQIQGKLARALFVLWIRWLGNYRFCRWHFGSGPVKQRISHKPLRLEPTISALHLSQWRRKQMTHIVNTDPNNDPKT
eukprot:5642964-Amphidinium_carterae.1